MKTKKITLTCNIPDSVTADDLEKFLYFKHYGHGIAKDILSKFDDEELDVDHISIN